MQKNKVNKVINRLTKEKPKKKNNVSGDEIYICIMKTRSLDRKTQNHPKTLFLLSILLSNWEL